MLKANPGYWRGEPAIKNATYRPIPNEASRSATLLSGEVDLVPTLSPALMTQLGRSPDLKVATAPGFRVIFLGFNVNVAPLDNAKVREAIDHAVDRESLSKNLLRGLGKPTGIMVPPMNIGYDPSLTPTKFDPELAKRLVKESGYDGTPIALQYPNNNLTLANEVAQAVAGYLTAVGLKVQVRPFEMNLFTNDIIPNGKTGEMFQMGWGGWTFDYDNTAYLMYHSGERWNPYDKDPGLDAMLEGQRLIADRGEREAALRKIANFVADHALELPLYNVDTYYGVNRRVKGLVVPPDNRFRLIGASVD